MPACERVCARLCLLDVICHPLSPSTNWTSPSSPLVASLDSRLIKDGKGQEVKFRLSIHTLLIAWNEGSRGHWDGLHSDTFVPIIAAIDSDGSC